MVLRFPAGIAHLCTSPSCAAFLQPRINSNLPFRNFSSVKNTLGFINGEWRQANSGKTFEVSNPSTGQVLAAVSDMGASETREAIESANKAFSTWQMTTPKERSALLRRWWEVIMSRHDEISKLITLENGKPLKEAQGEVNYSADYLLLYAEEAKRIHGEIVASPVASKEMVCIRQPIGVVGMLTPWNFPLAMIARKASAALAAGCACVIKPAEDTPLSTLFLADTAQQAGIPKGVVNVVTASRNNTPDVGKTLCESEQVAGLSFTGSTGVGKLLYKQSASTVKRLALELGGNAPFIVFDSADLRAAVQACIASKFRNTGQTCVSTNRILVQETVHDEFIQLLTKAIEGLVTGDGLDPKSTLGPLINKAQFDKVSKMVEDAKQKGAKCVIGGKPHQLGKTFYKPTLLTDINESMLCYGEEIFGPVALTMRFRTEEEAIRIANDTRSGLASYFFSSNLSQMRRVGKSLQYGMVGINEGLVSAAEAPFGGIKESGFGREGSKHGLDEYTYIKYMCFGNLE